ncbi:cellulose biosynthesis cyclic di-GMP-binding regulatory protein BcsB [Paracoccus niistensis]|uniref:Cyclic di-GMP-binding protein n=1 Tax=Paracoccus niistensis TaxID=632935 RepID=A0ABV6IAW1_9RHOB
MRRQRCFVALLAIALGIFAPAFAQDEQPLIRLGTEPAAQAPPDSPETDTETTLSADADAVPQIQLPRVPSTASETSDAPASPTIPERDRGEEVVPAAAQEWFLPLVPVASLPARVQMGASLPAPGVLRLTGEIASIDLRLDLPPEVAIPAEVLLKLRSTINVLPDVAAMTVTINDASPVVLPLDHLSGFETVGVPATGLTAGTNRISIELRQPHRIYCGPEASFGVWTEIHLTESGVPVDAAIMAADAAGLALALRAQAATGRTLPILVAENEDAAVQRKLAEMVNRAMSGQVPVEFRSFYELGPPLPLSIALIASDRSHAELREGAAGGLVLQVEHSAGELPSLDELLPPMSLPPNTAPALTPGATTNLAELGQADIIGRTRYFRHEVPFDLPLDWLLLSNQKARLDLRYGFADSLPEGATLLVKINDQTIRLLPLDRDGGQMQAPLDIIFAANLLHGGRNSLVFEMVVPGNPPDAICLPRRADMLVVTNDSTLTVPPAPAMTLAGIATPLSHLGPGSVMVPEGVRDPATLERAAAEFAARLTPRSGEDGGSVRLNLIGVGDMSLIPLDHLELSVRDLQEALVEVGQRPLASAAAGSAAPVRRYQFTEESPGPADQLVSDSDSRDVIERPQRSEFKDWLAGKLDGLTSATFIGSGDSLSAWLAAKQGRAFLLRPDGQEPGELWLVLGSQVSVDAAVQGLVGLRDSGLAKGEAAMLSAEGTWEIWSPVRPPELREPLRLSNLRAVLGNYASWSPLLFTVTILGLALLSAIPALLFILFTRRRGQL